MTELKLYRHIYHKDIFLCRNWNYCGGGPDTAFYYATKDMIKAVVDANKDGFLHWTHSFLDQHGKTMLKAKITDRKEIELDGYKGYVEKELVFPVAEFELVKFVEG